MLIIKMNLLHVEYDSIVERFLPELFKNVTEESKLSLKVANELLVKNKVTNKIATGVLKLVPRSAKEKVAVDLLVDNKLRITTSLNKFLEERQVYIKISSINIIGSNGGENGMIKIEITLEELNYDLLIKSILPKVLETMSKNDGKQKNLANVLIDKNEVLNQMLTAALDILPQDEKNEFIVKIFEVYKNEIIDMINQKVTEQQISAVVSEINVNN